jgi:hypothetical protein
MNEAYFGRNMGVSNFELSSHRSSGSNDEVFLGFFYQISHF